MPPALLFVPAWKPFLELGRTRSLPRLCPLLIPHTLLEWKVSQIYIFHSKNPLAMRWRTYCHFRKGSEVDTLSTGWYKEIIADSNNVATAGIEPGLFCDESWRWKTTIAYGPNGSPTGKTVFEATGKFPSLSTTTSGTVEAEYSNRWSKHFLLLVTFVQEGDGYHDQVFITEHPCLRNARSSDN